MEIAASWTPEEGNSFEIPGVKLNDFAGITANAHHSQSSGVRRPPDL